MVQAKHKKSKPPRKQQTAAKKHQKQADIAEFPSQLDALGLKIVQVTSDGNCFFRALADQLEGDENEHKKYRDVVVQYIKIHREDFEPFIEDEVPFDDYCKSMGEDGTWAGNMELQAASLVTISNICIHRSMSPRWYIRNFHTHEVRMIHISYHDGEHYNSVRLKEDPGNGPAKNLTIKADSEIPSTPHLPKSAVNKSNWLTGERNINMSSIKLVMSGTGCQQLKKVEQVLQDVDGDVDAAIEYLIAEMEMNENISSDDELSCGKENSTSHGDNRTMEDSQDTKCEGSISGCGFDLVHDFSVQNNDKKIPTNKLCSCGSRKKQKACCGASGGKSTTRLPKCNRSNASKGRNERKDNKRGDGRQVHGSMVLPDVGALCI